MGSNVRAGSSPALGTQIKKFSKMKNLIFIYFITIFTFSQNCLYDYVVKEKCNGTAYYYEAYKHTYETYLKRGAKNFSETYYIPVVFHVVWNQESQNIPDYVLESQIDVLNEDYRRLNENSSETREEFLEFAGDANIEFFLANIDPDGNPTSGIIRTYTEREEFLMFDDVFSNEITLDEVKFSSSDGSDAWDTNRYLNIWICNIGVLDIFGLELGQVYGYAYPPVNIEEALSTLEESTVPDWPVDMLSNDSAVQGVVLHYTAVGRNNPSADEDGMTENNLGRTAVHEVGHYLGLRHIWGDAVAFFGDDGCTVDDGILDTPNASDQAGYICDFNKNTCLGDDFGSIDDLPDMVENYMDYSPGACQNLFTNGQINIMRTVLEISRTGLINTEPSLNLNRNILIDNSFLINRTNILGRNISGEEVLFIEIYSDGSVKKKINIK